MTRVVRWLGLFMLPVVIKLPYQAQAPVPKHQVSTPTAVVIVVASTGEASSAAAQVVDSTTLRPPDVTLKIVGTARKGTKVDLTMTIVCHPRP